MSKPSDKIKSNTKSKTEVKSKTVKSKPSFDKNIMFILFPGHGNSEKDWNNPNEKSKLDDTFISTLKKLGKICYISFPWNNIFYYMNKDGPSRFTDDLNFYMDDYDVKSYCKKVFNELKDFKGKFIPIGHSIGALFAHTFSEQYASRCAFSVTIDGSFLTGVATSSTKLDIS